MWPWASFGSFQFQPNERPVDNSDVGWNRNASIAQNINLGSSADDIQVMAPRSKTRSFEIRLTPDRFAQLDALTLTTDDFTDWDRPAPNLQRAFLSRVTQLKWEARLCSDGNTQRVIRTRIELVSQNNS